MGENVVAHVVTFRLHDDNDLCLRVAVLSEFFAVEDAFIFLLLDGRLLICLLLGKLVAGHVVTFLVHDFVNGRLVVAIGDEHLNEVVTLGVVNLFNFGRFLVSRFFFNVLFLFSVLLLLGLSVLLLLGLIEDFSLVGLLRGSLVVGLGVGVVGVANVRTRSAISVVSEMTEDVPGRVVGVAVVLVLLGVVGVLQVVELAIGVVSSASIVSIGRLVVDFVVVGTNVVALNQLVVFVVLVLTVVLPVFGCFPVVVVKRFVVDLVLNRVHVLVVVHSVPGGSVKKRVLVDFGNVTSVVTFLIRELGSFPVGLADNVVLTSVLLDIFRVVCSSDRVDVGASLRVVEGCGRVSVNSVGGGSHRGTVVLVTRLVLLRLTVDRAALERAVSARRSVR